ncbi:unnamed protein product [Zymoseptoria tritici ST99CH_3D1]|nr:unnamed protein product [Zymoseptoria tritici ST99CH_3D1]
MCNGEVVKAHSPDRPQESHTLAALGDPPAFNLTAGPEFPRPVVVSPHQQSYRNTLGAVVVRVSVLQPSFTQQSRPKRHKIWSQTRTTSSTAAMAKIMAISIGSGNAVCQYGLGILRSWSTTSADDAAENGKDENGGHSGHSGYDCGSSDLLPSELLPSDSLFPNPLLPNPASPSYAAQPEPKLTQHEQ